MNSAGKRGLRRIRATGFVRRVGGLAVVVTASVAVLSPVALWMGGSAGLWAAGAGAAACLAGGISAEVAANWLSHERRPLAAILAGMLLRMAVPLVALVIVHYHGGVLVQGGMVYYVLAFYLITLMAETWMALGEANPRRGESEGLETHG
ncbi:MAG: hypothetical protein A2W31_13230 [Planctomycetes bacterium RBG_16_64_10]|nr:MAG: hypothetical protein A2W31_13230 [Planctomycetes bacterium RBG_16_64_10]